MGAWLSWLERTVHIREVVGSSPSAPILYLIIMVRHTPEGTGECLTYANAGDNTPESTGEYLL